MEAEVVDLDPWASVEEDDPSSEVVDLDPVGSIGEE